MLDGEAHRLGGLGTIRAATIEEAPTAARFVLPGKDIVVRGRVSAPAKDFVGWVYADPKGPEHNTVNCSVADLELTVERPACRRSQLTLAGRRRLRVRDAGDRPRHPDPALSGRLIDAYRSAPPVRSTAEPSASLRRLRRRPAVDQLVEGHPAVIGAERGGELVAADHGDAAGPVEPGPDDPRRGAALGDDDPLQPARQVAARAWR